VNAYDRKALDDDYRLSLLWRSATPIWQATQMAPFARSARLVS
jgi:hypothetical protein